MNAYRPSALYTKDSYPKYFGWHSFDLVREIYPETLDAEIDGFQ